MLENCFARPLRHTATASRARRACGFSLVEVLISIVILSFGMLGMVGLQAAAIQANRDARLQSVASFLARELAEMMRGNKQTALATGAANPYLIDVANPAGATPMVPTTPAFCLSVGTAACANNLEVANAQMTDWLTRVDAELPSARVVVCVDAAPYDGSGIPQWGCTPGTLANTVIKVGWTRGTTNRADSSANAFVRAAVPSLVLPITPGNIQ